MKITGTFLDEITYDIASQNWGAEEWDKEFATMQAAGIDTVIIIRCGLRDQIIYPSKVMPRNRAMLPVYEDLGMLFLDLAAKYGMKLFWGTYDTSPEWWECPAKSRELIDIHQDLIPEIWERYGSHKAFAGWYITYEFALKNEDHMNLVYEMAKLVKGISPQLPTLISPFIQGVKAGAENAISLDEHHRQWDEILQKFEGLINIVAFQDGHVHITELPEYIRANAELMGKHGIECWSNIESFDRDVPLKFPPIDWRKFRAKMEAANQPGVSKLITFEFSHFMSPNSCSPAAHNLFRQYSKYHGMKLD